MWSPLSWSKSPRVIAMLDKSNIFVEDAAEKHLLVDESDRTGELDPDIAYVPRSDYVRLLGTLRLMVVINGCLLCGLAYVCLRPSTPIRVSYTESELARATSAYSPILNVLPVQYHDTFFNGTLWPPEKPDWSRLLPSDETDAIWEKFEPGYSFPLTRDDIIAMGKDPETTVRFPDEYFHLGDEAYVGTLDVLHKLHCLNTLRRNAMMDYGDDTPEKQKHGKLWWLHTQHCVDMLAQDLQCQASAEVITYNWRDTQPYPFPDFSIQRKCRDFDSLVEWRDSNAVSMDTWVLAMNKTKMSEPGDHYIQGTRQLPYEPGYYATWGFAGSDLYPNEEDYVAPFDPRLDEVYGERVEPHKAKDSGHSH